nr:peptidylprolyl isomerase [uncultured Oscillibacter sp.]
MGKRIMALALAICLGLSGCAKKKEEENASLLGRAAELGEELVLLTVDGREIPAWRYLYWLAFTCDQIREKYKDSGLTLDWEAPVSGGSLADYAKDQALADTALYATVETLAERYGCALSEKERAALTELWEEQSAAHGGEAAYLKKLADLGLDRLRSEELAEVGLLYAKLYNLCLTGGSELSELLGTADSLTVDRILISAGEDREAARERAAEVFSRLNGAEDPEAVFPILAAEGDDAAGPRTLLPGDGTLPPALEEAAKALEEGQCSGILESEEGFSILRRLASEGETLAGEAFDRMLQSAAEEALIQTTPAYESLSAAAFDRALAELREAEE